MARSPARFSLARDATGRDGNAGFNIRGLDGNRVLMLVDGIRLPRSYAFGANAFGRDYLDLGLLQRMELLRGAASALYGSDAIAGLVHFISADPAAFLDGGKRLGARASLSFDGDDQGRRLGATLAGQPGESLQWLLAASLGRAQALETMGGDDAANADRTRPNPQQDRSAALLGKIVLTPGGGQRHRLTIEHINKSAAHELLSARAKPPLTATSTLSASARADALRSRATWEGSWQLDSAWADEFKATLGYQGAHSREYLSEDRSSAPDRVRDVRYDEGGWQAGLQGRKLLRPGAERAHKITYGVDHVAASVRNLQTGVGPPAGESFPLKRFPDTGETSSAIYAQDEIVAGAWSVTPGLRLDSFRIAAAQAGFGAPAVSLSGQASSPKLGLLYRVDPVWSLLGHYAGGFRAPDAGQVNAFFENPVGHYKTIPNAALRPEKSRNVEIGVRARRQSLAFDAVAFSGRYRDFIEDLHQVGGSGTAGDPRVYQSLNIARVRIDGFEIKGSLRWNAAGGGTWSMPLAYGRARGRDAASGQPVNSVDPERWSAGLRYETSAWLARLDLRHSAAKRAKDVSATPGGTQFLPPAYTVLDLTGQWRIRKDLRLNAGIYNLGDKKHWRWADVRGLAADASFIDAYSQPGRHLRLALVADF